MNNLTSYTQNSAALLVAVERERRRRQQAPSTDPAAFLARTRIEVQATPDDVTLAPFVVWPAQQEVLAELARERLIVFLKARQLGISWLVCGFVLHNCTTRGQSWLFFSQGQLEANELTRRTSLMHHHHADRLPALLKDNTQELQWANGGRVLSLPATGKAGRSFTASGVVLDEWAFMQRPKEVLAAVKPVIDAGGKLIIISTADGQGTPYHAFWNAASGGSSGYRAIFLPWHARPDRGPGWREEKIRESGGDVAGVLREYPETPDEAFSNAVGRVFDQWSAANVTEEAEYIPGAGPILWFLDDGYSAGNRPATKGLDPNTGGYVADAHPRVILLAQLRPDGRVCVFAESYACLKLSDQHISEVQALDYPEPDYVSHGPGAAEIRGRLHAAGLPAKNAHTGAREWVEESIKALQRALAPDANGWRRVLVHPRCRHLQQEMVSYRRDDEGKVIKAFDHGPDALRGGIWTLRHE